MGTKPGGGRSGFCSAVTAHGKFSFRNLAAAYNAGLGHVLEGGSDKPYEDKITEAYTFFGAVSV